MATGCVSQRGYDLKRVSHFYRHIEPFGPDACAYCGERANTVDHVAPVSYIAGLLDVMQRLRSSLRECLVTVPACSDCNSLLGSFIPDSLANKRAELKRRLYARHESLLASETWSDADINRHGRSLRSYLLSQEQRRRVIERRLAFVSSISLPPIASNCRTETKPSLSEEKTNDIIRERAALFAAGLRKCTICAEKKPVEEFYRTKANKHGRIHHCRQCVRQKAKSPTRFVGFPLPPKRFP